MDHLTYIVDILHVPITLVWGPDLYVSGRRCLVKFLSNLCVYIIIMYCIEWENYGMLTMIDMIYIAGNYDAALFSFKCAVAWTTTL